ncbi:MAG: Rrf2 family transcriptional regulator [Verrucomicrobiota bacterium]|nr:Rrf2 family transcriptional regulator [Verrucomicrobiota bacterium]
MRVTQAGEYALLGVLYLARQPVGQLTMIDQISEAEKIPKSFLAKIFQSLTHAGLVKSRQGAKGGFALSRKAEDISVLNVLEAIEGKLALQRCLEEVPDCERRDNCTLCAVFGEVQNKVNEVFSRTSVRDLMKPKDAVVRQVQQIAQVKSVN